MPTIHRITLALAMTVAPLAQSAHARATLVDSHPSQGSVVAKPTSLDITFSEPVVPAALSLSLVMTGMPGMATHKPMAIKGFAVTVNAKQASLRFPRPLPTGSYQLDWKITGDAATPATGSLTFRVQ